MAQGSTGWARSSVVVTTKKRIKDDSNKIFLIFSSFLLVTTFYTLYLPPLLVVMICDCHQWYILSRLLDKFALIFLLTVYTLVIWYFAYTRYVNDRNLSTTTKQPKNFNIRYYIGVTYGQIQYQQANFRSNSENELSFDCSPTKGTIVLKWLLLLPLGRISIDMRIARMFGSFLHLPCA